MSRTAAILLAAGKSTRMDGTVTDKILANLVDRPVFAHSVAAFLTSGVADYYIIVCRDQPQLLLLSAFAPTPSSFVRGGSTRADSVINALAELPDDVEYVFIHDCARPLITPEQLVGLLKVVRKENAVVLAHRVTDTIKIHSDSGMLKTPDRSTLWAAETPQVFSRDLIVEAYQKVASRNIAVTDDASAVERLKHPIALLENPQPNPKITHPGDLDYCAYLLGQRENSA